ncbi:hypothetical protein AVEN_267298-1 [Araneus ventricosus]|uniref:Uncharacterized protein n=1 Tax=Araneus ventricosus TaxID=182803 RepID=A0A4Y2DJL0_ARAVE|nr:hypothetical protein AVEN_267298-1 [Araneus ventricosus]
MFFGTSPLLLLAGSVSSKYSPNILSYRVHHAMLHLYPAFARSFMDDEGTIHCVMPPSTVEQWFREHDSETQHRSWRWQSESEPCRELFRNVGRAHPMAIFCAITFRDP